MDIRLNETTFNDPVAQLLEGLDDRSRDIVKRRFGLDSGHRETLEGIGREYGITRERVRQIEAQAKKVLQTRLEALNGVADFIEHIFRDRGGIMPEEQVVVAIREKAGIDVLPAIVGFYLELLPDYEYLTKDMFFMAHWRHPELVPKEAIETVKTGQQILTETKQPKSDSEFVEQIKVAFARQNRELPVSYIEAWLMASRRMTRNPFGEWGLVGWAEITPRGVGDKAYAVLRRHGQPAHFRKIAAMINEAKFDRKNANPQTVHNELIKDSRFVLVGRGLYALTQWGYVPGTVADVVEDVLRKGGQALTREEIVERVLAQRVVKKNTILLSLQDQSRFAKTKENRYTLNKRS